MQRAFQQLVQEALDYAKGQPPHAWSFATAAEMEFFRASQARPINKRVQQPKAHETDPQMSPVDTAQAPPKITPVPSDRKKPVVSADTKPAEADKKEQPASKKTTSSEPRSDKQPPSEEMLHLLKKIAPALATSEQVPDDQTAKRISSAWKEKLTDANVLLIVLNPLPDTLELMKNLAKAVQKEFGSVKLMTGDRLEQEKRWDLFFQQNTFQLIIASAGIENYPGLLMHYRALPAQQAVFLGNIPLITLEAASVYKNSGEKKLELWRELQNLLSRKTYA